MYQVRRNLEVTAYLTTKVDHDVLGLIAAEALFAARVQAEPWEPQQSIAADNAIAALIVRLSAVGTAVGASFSDAVLFSFVVVGRRMFLCGPCVVRGGEVHGRRFLSVARRGWCRFVALFTLLALSIQRYLAIRQLSV